MNGTTSAGTAAIATAAASGGSHQRGASARRAHHAAQPRATARTGTATAVLPRSARDSATGEGSAEPAIARPSRSS
ncbi:hypothetical protein [Streptomyces sp. NPDC059455]|uniref:hypothetical protein n=1 Tax=Streptomyces sp. NPDC059455 TaxID=3346837 RepID=UPI0036C68D61